MLAGLVEGNQLQQHLAAWPHDAVCNHANARLPAADGSIEFTVDGRARLTQHRKGASVCSQGPGQCGAQLLYFAALAAQHQKVLCHGGSPFVSFGRLCSP